jgi:hypothetical protein
MTMHRGIVALGTVLILGAILVEIGVAGAFVASVLTSTDFNARLTARAYAAAQAGIEEGLLRLGRSGINFRTPLSSSSPYISMLGIQLEDSNRTVDVQIYIKTCSSPCDTGSTMTGTIEATGKTFLKQRKLQGSVSINAGTGKVILLRVDDI